MRKKESGLKLFHQIHLSKSFFEILINPGGADIVGVFDVFRADFGKHPVEIHTVCKTVAKLIAAIPGVFRDISSDMQRPEFIPFNFTNHFSCNGHNLNSEHSWNFRSGDGEYKMSGG